MRQKRSVLIHDHSRVRGKASPLVLVCILLFAIVTVFAGARGPVLYGEVPQGGSGTFAPDGYEDSQSDAHWEILGPGGGVVARGANPNGWSADFDGSIFTVSAPVSADAEPGYRVRYHTGNSLRGGGSSGNFSVTPGFVGTTATTTTTGTTATTGTTSTTTGTTATTGTTSTTTGTTATTGTTSTTTGTTATTGTTSSTGSTSTTGSSPTIQIIDIEETRAHVVTSDYQVNNAAPYSSNSGYTQNGVQYTVTTGVSFAICSDNALNDPLTTSVNGATSGTFSLQDTMASGRPTFTMTGFLISSNAFPVTMTYPSAGGPGRLFVEQTINSVTTANGQVVGSTTSKVILTRRDYNLVKALAAAVALDSRKYYGQPDIYGESPGDANAPAQNVNFNGWVYDGGLFAGNAPFATGDQSGAARTQFYLSGLPSFTHVVWQDLAVCYLGGNSSFVSDPNYCFSIPSATDPNLEVASAAATWANAWNLATATLEQSLSVSSYASGQYVNFQGSALAPQMILNLANEAADVANSVPDWRYFASPAYASASGLITVTDAQPRAWIMDQTLAEN